MNNTQPPLNAAPKLQNAFQAVRPRGENKPSAAPVPANVGRTVHCWVFEAPQRNR